ncbi:DNA recombination protein RmuC [Sphingomonas carotinifaciens]|uniref:DNA recombination protein RmuC n=1 Tax=Sphingomonas carotinifaciens TaxID=1166323 RepID=UPI000DD5F425|nr:DNA recombination protein RmuC [Sphingomonas carotinifaciens]
MPELIIVACLALGLGLLIGWLVASRAAQRLAADLATAQARAADFDLVRTARDAVERERNEAMQNLAELRGRAAELEPLRTALASAHAERNEANAMLAELRARADEREAAHAVALEQLKAAREQIGVQFGDTAAKALETAQRQFLERAEARFRQSEEASGQSLKALLQPVTERLQRYEEGVAKVELERRDAFSELRGQIDAMRIGQERVSGEAAKLVNALRNAPKARGRWGEQQLRNVLESCGLSEHTDFQMEVSVADGEGGRLRPDAIVRVPGGKSLIIDAKVSLNAYQDAFGAVDEAERHIGLAAHAQSMRTHINGLGNKAYWAQFDDAPEYVVMFVPGEHFLSAALEHDPGLWDFAFEKRVLLATPTNLIAIARTIDAVWRQEKLAKQAQEIGTLGKELYQRLAVMGGHVAKLGKNLDTAMGAYNAFVGSLESNVLTSARRFEALNIDTGGKAIDTLPVGEQTVRPLTKLAVLPDAAE